MASLASFEEPGGYFRVLVIPFGIGMGASGYQGMTFFCRAFDFLYSIFSFTFRNLGETSF